MAIPSTYSRPRIIDEEDHCDVGMPRCSMCGSYTKVLARQTTMCVPCYNIIIMSRNRKGTAKRNEAVPNLVSVLKQRISGALANDLRRSRLTERPDLTMNYLLSLFYEQNGLCALSGRKMSLAPAVGGKPHPDTLSLDRIDFSRPHIRGNVRFVTYQVNLARGRWGDTRLLELCLDIVVHFHNKVGEDATGGSVEDSPESAVEENTG